MSTVEWLFERNTAKNLGAGVVRLESSLFARARARAHGEGKGGLGGQSVKGFLLISL